MSRGRKAKSISSGLEVEQIFNKSQGFYFQYIITQLGKKNKKITNENADDLFQKIKQAKENLIREKQIKQGKLQDAEIQDELLFEIPKNWIWCKLDDLSVNITDGTHQTPTYVESGKPFISATHVKPFRFIPENYKFVSEKAYEEYIKNRKAEIGDVLVTRVGAIGEAAVIDVDLDFAFYVSVGLIKPFKDFVFPEFLAYVINSPYGNLYSKGNVSSKGSSAGNFNLGRIRSFLIPLPPRSEQKMILDFLQDFGNNVLDVNREYFDSEIENQVVSIHQAQIYNNQISTELNHQLALVKELRQAYLREAMQGKLVPQDDRDESAKILLEKIKAEKEKLVAEKRIKRDRPLPPIRPEEIPFEIPSNWAWCRLGEICEDMEAGKSPNCKNEPANKDEWGVIKTTAVQFLYFLENENKVLSKDFDINLKFKVNQDDVLITRAGPTNRVGIVCHVDSVRDKLILSDKTVRIKYIKDYVFPKFLAVALNSEIAQSFLKTKMVGMAVSQVNISQDNMKKTPLSLPPLAEQERIVAKLEKLMKFCDELETNIRQGIANADQLLQTVLKEALEPKESVLSA